MREILFRGKLVINNKWEYSRCPDGRLCSGIVTYDFDPETVGQFTGLYDSTKWEALTDAEKMDFYKQHYIGEDGMSVRFQNVDDVKHLWKGRRIFEGDIVVCKQEISGNWIDYYVEIGFVEMKHGAFGLHRKQGYYRPFKDWLEDYEYEVIGNIHDNPELLKGGVENA